MARRYIGDAALYLQWRDTTPENRERYTVIVTAKDDDGKRLVWKTDELRSGVGGVASGKGYAFPVDSPDAYDLIAQSAISFATHTEGPADSKDQRELEARGFPPHHVAKAIERAVEIASTDNGYEVRRSRGIRS